MFTKQELKKIDRKYFEILRKSAFYVDLKSKNTGHSWSIYSRQLDTKTRSLIIRHKHHDKDEYHEQLRYHPRTIEQAQSMIKAHDKWHLNGRKKS